MGRSSAANIGPLVLALAGALALALSGCGGEATPTSPAKATATYQAVTFLSTDGLELSGHLFGEGDVVVILAHMFPADQGSWQDFARELAEEGYMALTFDFRGYGSSQGPREIDQIDKDVEGALDYVEELGASSIVLTGASMGGTASIKVAARREVSGVISLSGAVEFRGLEALADVKQVQVPKLFIAADGDQSARQSLETLYDSSPGEREFLVLAGSSAHGTDLLKGTESRRVREEILGFLERTLRQ